GCGRCVERGGTLGPGNCRIVRCGRRDPSSAVANARRHGRFWADLLADNWSSLTECVRTGESAASLRPEILKRWQEESEGPAIFRAVMGTSPAQSYQPIAQSWDFSNARLPAHLPAARAPTIHAL